MKISVVTVCFNSARTIGHTIESFVRQDHADKELVIVDGGSTDDTLDIIRSFPLDDMRISSGPDRGIYDAMNKGLARFTGDAVGFLNSDDRFHDDGILATIASGLDKADIVFGDIDFVTDHHSQRVVRRWRSSPYQRGAFGRGWMAPHPSLYVRRRVAEAVGPFDLRYSISADYDWMLRAFELHGFDARLEQRVFTDMMVGGKSTGGLGAYVKANLESLQSRRKWLGAGPIDLALFAKPLGKVSQLFDGRIFQSRGRRWPATIGD